MIACIIQARNGNSRLPGKGSIELLGKPLLYHVIARVKRAKFVNEVIVAMPGAPEDRPLIELCEETKTRYFLGRAKDIEDSDIVGRFRRAAEIYEASWIVRICADNPCVEPSEIDALIRGAHGLSPDMLLTSNAENIWYNYDGFGGELFSFRMFEWMDIAVKSLLYREQPHRFWFDIHRFVYVGKPYPQNFRLDVNTPGDYERALSIYNHFGHNDFIIADVIGYLDAQNLAERAIP